MKYTKGYKYQLKEDLTIHTELRPEVSAITAFGIIQLDGTIIVRHGFAWDGSSGPAVDSKCSMRGSLAHDFLYQCFRQELLPQSMRGQADELYRELCLADGMSRFRAWMQYHAIRKFAKGAADPSHRREILKA